MYKRVTRMWATLEGIYILSLIRFGKKTYNTTFVRHFSTVLWTPFGLKLEWHLDINFATHPTGLNNKDQCKKIKEEKVSKQKFSKMKKYESKWSLKE